jgi:aminoglycoside phosphotransferase (APT) family kinase protein
MKPQSIRNAPEKYATEAAIVEWIESNLGEVQEINAFTRQRQTWRVDYTVKGENRSLLAKGARPWSAIPFSLNWEMQANRVLREQGAIVPAVLGIMDEPNIFFMEWVDSDIRPVGLLRQSTHGTDYAMPAERWATQLKYMEELAKIHAIPAEAFRGTETAFPQTAKDVALALFKPFYDMVDDAGLVDARVEFLRIWLERNIPEHRTHYGFVTGDCCQYLSRGTEIVAMIDFEISYLGDPLQDLSCFRCRHPVEDLGDIYELFRHYARVTGQPIDVKALAYQTVVFQAIAWMGMVTAVNQSYRGGNALEEYGQVGFGYRRGFEALAEIEGVKLEDLPRPIPFRMPYVDAIVSNLSLDVASLPLSDVYTEWQRQCLSAAPKLLSHFLALGPWYVTEGIREIEEIVGGKYEDHASAWAALKEFVQKAGPEHNEKLIRFFHRDAQRECWLAAGPDAPADHLLFVKQDTIFDKGL